MKRIVNELNKPEVGLRREFVEALEIFHLEICVFHHIGFTPYDQSIGVYIYPEIKGHAWYVPIVWGHAL